MNFLLKKKQKNGMMFLGMDAIIGVHLVLDLVRAALAQQVNQELLRTIPVPPLTTINIFLFVGVR